ncbi:related to effector family protein Eff1 [Sporisorium reilianum f. sp. reilianum]|uniref:Related to effector family protein Eff1 n=1 Tax=Sporisorium reilianum f. sp. reilianum TaxID=72559 RepID=A0A2N8UDR2_9BASI|nr:related to effector family protein Eff1 [Sporisorium reilianum f. sp. reilianum]
MRRSILCFIALLWFGVGAGSRPMWRWPSGDAAGSSNQPSFGWQNDVGQPAWSPDLMQQLSAETSPEPILSHDGSGSGGSASPRAAAVSSAIWHPQGTTAVVQQNPSWDPAKPSTVTRPEWEKSMRKALGNSNLVFVNIDKEFVNKPRLWMAHNAESPWDLHAKIYSPHEQAPPSSSRAPAALNKLKEKAIQIKFKTLPFAKLPLRNLMYLNSQSNMDAISHDYFAGKMRFLPIDTGKLTWTLLDSVLRSRDFLYLLPPRYKGDLGLLFAEHRLKTVTRKEGLQSLTGELTTKDNIFTLWSPLLVDSSRTTMVFHGVGVLDYSDLDAMLAKLDELKAKWEGAPPFWDAAYYLESLTQRFATDLYPEEHRAADSSAVQRLERAAAYLRRPA